MGSLIDYFFSTIHILTTHLLYLQLMPPKKLNLDIVSRSRLGDLDIAPKSLQF